uniref:Uncharacterized protein n=1 Tax=Oryza sativa subsp. japonica TaxID=39947 RepID=Q6YSA3_ORYSJ|nr:hypothetical protein [Oryza sativa Japonica Group]BAD10780.1 hypothetical protein [Oryza sativa Japonica Group]
MPRCFTRRSDSLPTELLGVIFELLGVIFEHATHHPTVPWCVCDTRLCGTHNDTWVAVTVDLWQGFAAVNLFTSMRAVAAPGAAGGDATVAEGGGARRQSDHREGWQQAAGRAEGGGKRHAAAPGWL